MNIDFANLNLAPTPNPKALKVERVSIRIVNDGKQGPLEQGVIRNSSVHPEAVIRG